MESLWRGVWRAHTGPDPGLPLNARSTGQGDLLPGWRHGKGVLSWFNLYWCVEGRGGPARNGRRQALAPGEVVIHAPGDRISGYPIEEAWRYRWLTVDGARAQAILDDLGLRPGLPRHAGPCPLDLFDQAARDLAAVGPAAVYCASATAYSILLHAARGLRGIEAHPPSAAVAEIRGRIEAEHGDPALTVAGLAARVGMHRSRLCRLYKEETGLSPKEHIQQLRLRKALDLIHDPAYSIKEVAHACGFADPAYFARFLRDHAGASPRALRARSV